MATYAAMLTGGWRTMRCMTQSGMHSREGLVTDSITLSNAYCKCKCEAETQDSHELYIYKALDAMQPFAVASVKTQRQLVRRWQGGGEGIVKWWQGGGVPMCQ